MRGKQRAKTVVNLEAPRKAAPPQKAPPPPPGETDPLYGVVLLKVALELKRRKEGSVEEILRGVLARMRIPEAEFQAFLKQQGGRLKELGLGER
ncbi:hypothetical protein [Stigmatella erecta]|uniref:Uncharacterized protein n=1 Tax=Stigmatella erecta TaxID=83460 RepID=A0A1I0CU34_9BACT|nr:hypothetical protein [Stigmatella erecta]SET23047.1 hypothetical protein SAMN05443639_102247 [Stigmatella erecta]